MTTVREAVLNFVAADEESIWESPSGHSGDFDIFVKPRPAEFRAGQLWYGHPTTDHYNDVEFLKATANMNADDFDQAEIEWREKNKRSDEFFVLDTVDGDVLRGFIVIHGSKLADRGDVVMSDSPIGPAFIVVWRGSVNLLPKHLVDYFGEVNPDALNVAIENFRSLLNGTAPPLTKALKRYRKILEKSTACYDAETIATVLE